MNTIKEIVLINRNSKFWNHIGYSMVHNINKVLSYFNKNKRKIFFLIKVVYILSRLEFGLHHAFHSVDYVT